MLNWLRKGKKPTRALAELLPDYPVDPGLLRQALTHKSAGDGIDNERLEFLGDAVLELIVSDHLFQTRPEFHEGDLTRARVASVSEPTLADAARRLGLGNQLILSRGEETSGGRNRPSILSDAFEAVVAALFLSGGLDLARRFVLEQIAPTLDTPGNIDSKTRLQELTQRSHRCPPTYRIAEETGPPHERSFTAEVLVAGRVVGSGTGRSKKAAEQAAAELALEELTRCQTPSPDLNLEPPTSESLEDPVSIRS